MLCRLVFFILCNVFQARVDGHWHRAEIKRLNPDTQGTAVVRTNALDCRVQYCALMHVCTATVAWWLVCTVADMAHDLRKCTPFGRREALVTRVHVCDFSCCPTFVQGDSKRSVL